MSEYRTKTGSVLSDEDIEALADEAEQGYDVSQIKPASPEVSARIRELTADDSGEQR